MAKRTKPQRSRPRRAADAFSIVLSRLLSLTRRPVTLLLLTASVAFTISYQRSASDNYVTQIAKRISKNDALKPLGDYLSAHVVQTIGLMWYGVPVAARRNNALLWIVAYALAFLAPPAPILEYPIQALLAYLFFSTANLQVRVLLVLAASYLFYSGFGLTSLLGKPPGQTT